MSIINNTDKEKINSYINVTIKIINMATEINNIDSALENKYFRNKKDLELYNKLLDSSNNYLYIILKNLK